MSGFLDWLDHRTGYRGLVHDALYEHIPGGARWRYVWGSTLVFAFVAQIVTGIILWSAYSPSAQTAWESIYYIQFQMTGGWLLRGVHHFMAHTMVLLMAIHFVQVVVDGAYRAPREINFWIGLVMMQVVLGLSLTGYLLPWDEKGYWATKVATNMMALVPLAGPALQKVVVGGSDYGHHTLTRFFALHAGVLPATLAGLTVIHVALFRRHGLKTREPYKKPDCAFWPDQVLRDAIACLAVMIVVLLLVFRNYGNGAHELDVLPGEVFGAELTAPADPAENYSAARPENYFLFLFQLLKYLEVFPPIVGAIVVPGLVMLSLFAMPIVGRWDLGHRFNVVWTFALLVGVGVLTAIAVHSDYNGEDEHSRHFLAAVTAAEHKAERAVVLAQSPDGIPAIGALSMLRSDAKLQGPKLFRQHCASCHSYVPPAGVEADESLVIAVEHPTASNLWGFGTREWVLGILNPQKIIGPDYFGHTKFKEGDMAMWVEDTFGADATAELSDEERKKRDENVKFVSYALANEAGMLREQFPLEWVEFGRKAIVEEFSCIDCHKFHDDGSLGMAPDLTGYASREWLREFISNPAHERFYPDTNDRMPAFAAGDDPAANRLSPQELEMLVAWLRGEWYEPGADDINPASPVE